MGKFGKIKSDAAPTFYQEGMLVFQALPKQGLGQIIVDATNSSIAHVGILHKNADDKWVVVESIGSHGIQPPIDEFIARAPGQVWFKEIKGLTTDAANKMVRRAIELSYAPYDIRYEYGNVEIYCSELVASAAQFAGIDLFDVDIPAAWMDRSAASVQQYLQDIHLINPGDALPKDWRVIPPNTLFYSNKLQDPAGVAAETNMPRDGMHHNALYDTVPGKSVAEKYAFLRSVWGSASAIVENRDPQSEKQNVHFEIKAGGQTYGLTLFRQFPEEAQLYAIIKRQRVRIARPERKSTKPSRSKEPKLRDMLDRAIKKRQSHL